MDLNLELVVMPVSDVDVALAFYRQMGWPTPLASVLVGDDPHRTSLRRCQQQRRSPRAAWNRTPTEPGSRS